MIALAIAPLILAPLSESVSSNFSPEPSVKVHRTCSLVEIWCIKSHLSCESVIFLNCFSFIYRCCSTAVLFVPQIWNNKSIGGFFVSRFFVRHTSSSGIYNNCMCILI